jgi:hypothetical protein
MKNNALKPVVVITALRPVLDVQQPWSLQGEAHTLH